MMAMMIVASPAVGHLYVPGKQALPCGSDKWLPARGKMNALYRVRDKQCLPTQPHLSAMCDHTETGVLTWNDLFFLALSYASLHKLMPKFHVAGIACLLPVDKVGIASVF